MCKRLQVPLNGVTHALRPGGCAGTMQTSRMTWMRAMWRWTPCSRPQRPHTGPRWRKGAATVMRLAEPLPKRSALAHKGQRMTWVGLYAGNIVSAAHSTTSGRWHKGIVTATRLAEPLHSPPAPGAPGRCLCAVLRPLLVCLSTRRDALTIYISLRAGVNKPPKFIDRQQGCGRPRLRQGVAIALKLRKPYSVTHVFSQQLFTQTPIRAHVLWSFECTRVGLLLESRRSATVCLGFWTLLSVVLACMAACVLCGRKSEGWCILQSRSLVEELTAGTDMQQQESDPRPYGRPRPHSS